MDKSLLVEKKIDIHTTPDWKWHPISDRETIKQYFFGTEAISDWEVGSPLIFRGEWEGKSYQDKGTVLAVEPEKMLQYNYWSGFSGLEDIEENYSLVTYRLESEDAGTLIHLSQEGFANEEAKSHGEGGWTMVLDKLKELMETG